MLYFENSFIRIHKNEVNQQSLTRKRYHYDIRLIDSAPQAYAQSRIELEKILTLEAQNPFEAFSWHIQERNNPNDFFSNANRHVLSAFLQIVYHDNFGAEITNKKAHVQNFLKTIGQRISSNQLLHFFSSTTRIQFKPSDIHNHPNSKIQGFLEIVDFLNVSGALSFPDKVSDAFLLFNLAKKPNFYRYNMAVGQTDANEELGNKAYESILEHLFQSPATKEVLLHEKKTGYNPPPT